MKLSSPNRLPQPLPALGGGGLSLTLAMTEYEHARDLTSGLIQPKGISLTSLLLPIEEVFFRYLKNAEFDAAETSFAKYISLAAAGDAPIIAIPVFPARVFRHSAVYVRADSGISSPKDLEGRRVGIPEWAQTAGVYVRGLLYEHYGVALESIDWMQASVNEPGRTEKVTLKLPPNIRYTPRPDKCLSEMLVSGEIDAALSARPPNSFLRGDPQVRRLFPDFRQEEEAYHAATGIFPIMHVVTIRRAILEAYPWVAMNLFTSFERAKDAALERMLEITTSRIPMPWGAAIAQGMAQNWGGDLWPYGVDANRATLDAFCRFAHSQHITASRLTPDDLFPQEVLQTTRV